MYTSIQHRIVVNFNSRLYKYSWQCMHLCLLLTNRGSNLLGCSAVRAVLGGSGSGPFDVEELLETNV